MRCIPVFRDSGSPSGLPFLRDGGRSQNLKKLYILPEKISEKLGEMPVFRVPGSFLGIDIDISAVFRYNKESAASAGKSGADCIS
jgi:hypothetical protein